MNIVGTTNDQGVINSAAGVVWWVQNERLPPSAALAVELCEMTERRVRQRRWVARVAVVMVLYGVNLYNKNHRVNWSN